MREANKLTYEALNDLGQSAVSNSLLDVTVEHSSLYITSYWLVITFNDIVLQLARY